jgi:hypothetical protein
MKLFFATAALILLAGPASLAAGKQKPQDPGSPQRAIGKIVYVFTGAVDDGQAANLGVATSVNCTDFGPGGTKLEFVTTKYNLTTVDDFTTGLLGNGATYTYSTHGAFLYAEDHSAPGGAFLDQGRITVRSTNTNVVCTATVEDAASASPIGWQLHGIRFNPVVGTQE